MEGGGYWHAVLADEDEDEDGGKEERIRKRDFLRFGQTLVGGGGAGIVSLKELDVGYSISLCGRFANRRFFIYQTWV
ncbi:hypothetical protein BGAL_0055g00080 [Botrytis galanthina]|uniref:Uncharacterized protein n=1 Tax=Botrytis galanthina TaxID=278940 RepID=A0A4S8RFG5_9HELO|nr:hypothetical protein BGAL_0055g00080 [Botrytis galanthina]